MTGEGQAAVFIAVDHCSVACVAHRMPAVALIASEALEPVIERHGLPDTS